MCALSVALVTTGCTLARDLPQEGQPDTHAEPPEEKPPPLDLSCLIDVGAPLDVGEPPDDCETTSTPAPSLTEGGCVTIANEQDAESATLAFDDNSGTKWVSTDPQGSITYEFPEGAAHAIATYRITVAGNPDERKADPTAWELLGSNDVDEASAHWTSIDYRENEKFPAAYQANDYPVQNDQAFRRYRLRVLDNGGAAKVQLAELELFAQGTPVFSVDNAEKGSGDHKFSFSSNWSGHTQDPESDRYHGSSSWSQVAGGYFTVTFVGSQVRLFGVVDPMHGTMGVSVDGGEEVEVDLYAPETGYNTLVFTSPRLCPGRHTLKGTVTGRRNELAGDSHISIDRIQVVP